MTTTETKLIKLVPDEGKFLNKGDIVSTCVYLGINDSPDNWREITAQEAEAIKKANEERAKKELEEHSN